MSPHQHPSQSDPWEDDATGPWPTPQATARPAQQPAQQPVSGSPVDPGVGPGVGPAAAGHEQVLFHGRTHAKILFWPVVAQVLLLAAHVAALRWLPEDWGTEALNRWADLVVHGLLLAGEVWFAILPALRWHHARFEITDRRIRERWGVLYKHSREIHLDRVTQVNEERGILDRIFGCGTIVIHDAANAAAIRFHDVPRFRRVRQILDDARQSSLIRATAQQAYAHSPYGQPAQVPPPWDVR